MNRLAWATLVGVALVLVSFRAQQFPGPVVPGEICAPAKPIASLPFTIRRPGRFVVTRNLTVPLGTLDGITIQAPDVTLDLNGHVLTGLPGSRHGVRIEPGASGVTVLNGSLRAWPVNGVHGVGAESCRFERLVVGGCGLTGIQVGASSTLVDCVAEGNGDEGIETIGDGGVIVRCTAVGNADNGINTNGSGVLVADCTANDNANVGFALSCPSGQTCDDVALRDSVASGNATGVDVNVSGASIRDVLAGSNSNVGIHVRSNRTSCRIESNHVVGSPVGIEVMGTDNLAVRNTVHGAMPMKHFDIAAGNAVGEEVTATTSLAGIAGPWANFALP